MFNRRQLFGAGAALLAAGAWTKTSAMGLPDAPSMASADMQPPVHPVSGPDYQPVVTLNGWTLPHRMNNGVKEFHLVAEPVEREMANGMTAISGATTASRRVRRSKRSRVIVCVSSSPTDYRNTPPSTGTA